MSRRALFRQRPVRHVYGGFDLTVWVADPMAQIWYDRDLEVPELDLLRQHRLGKGSVVFEFGAHQGVVALVLAKIVGSAGKVVAVEANPYNVTIARRNQALNRDVGHLELVHAAVADRTGVISFNRSLNGQVEDGSGEWGRVEVPACTVDELAAKYGQPDLVYIDVEGYESRALMGAARTLDSHPDFFIEVHGGCGLEKFGGSVEEIVSYFPEDRYHLFAASESESFTRFSAPADYLGKRFFLAAISRSA